MKDRKTAMKYAKRLKECPDLMRNIFAIKIGLIDIIDHGLSILKDIGKITQLPIICDLKISEIPPIAGEIARKVFEAGGYGIVVQGFVGPKVIEQIKDTAPELKIFMVSEMTHNDGGYTSDHLIDFARLAKKMGIFAIIGPGNRPERLATIKKEIQNDVKLVATGLSKQQGGEEISAINAGANYVIEGHNIIELLGNDSGYMKKKFTTLLQIVGLYGLVGSILGVITITLFPGMVAQLSILNFLIPGAFGATGATIGVFKANGWF